MSNEPEKQGAEEDNSLQFEVMPGAEALEQAENIDLSFLEPESEPENAEQSDAEESDPEAPQEEAVADSDDEPDSAEPAEAIEEEPEEEPEEEEEELPLAAESVKTEPKNPMVPKSRLDEVLAKQKALQKQVDDMKAANEKPAEAP